MAETEQDKINAIFKFLYAEFPKPSHAINHLYDGDRMANKFIIDIGGNDLILIITKLCWEKSDVNTLIQHLKNLDVVNALRKHSGKKVIVNRSINLDFEPK